MAIKFQVEALPLPETVPVDSSAYVAADMATLHTGNHKLG